MVIKCHFGKVSCHFSNIGCYNIPKCLRRKQCAEELKKLVQMQKMWALRKPILDAHILSLQGKVLELEEEIDEIVMEKIKCQI